MREWTRLRSRSARTLLVAAILAAATGCGRGDAPGEITPEVAALLDSANAAFRADDLEAARHHFREATRQGPDVAAAWFGVFLVEHALGNHEAADSAMRRTRELAPGVPLSHPAGPRPGSGEGLRHPQDG